ncbi:MAG: aldo/keto reductase [Pseudomonadota bacterium]
MSLDKKTVTLNNGVEMPWVGLGTWDQGEAAYTAATSALEAGYRAIDTGSFYQNEEDLGRAIADSDLPRKDIFVTTKVWNSEHGYDATLHSFDVSVSKLGLDVIDLYLVHWPVKDKYLETWRALEQLYRDGRVRAIGVSNFGVHHINALAEVSTVTPAVNQIDLHPLKTQKELVSFCQNRGIQVQAWAPLAQNTILEDPYLQDIASRHGKSVAQIVLRWHLQNGVLVIPKSSNPERIRQNIDVFDFNLDDKSMALIDGMDKNFHILGFEADGLLPELHEAPVQPWAYSL